MQVEAVGTSSDLSDNRASVRLEEAYQRYRSELRQFFQHKLHDPHSADDLIQTLYLALKKTRPAAEVRDPRQYLFGIAWNLLRTENRRMRTEQAQAVSCSFDDIETYTHGSNYLWVADDTSSERERAELDRVLAQLPKVCQVAMLRQYRDNRSYKEIAQELGVTTHAVKKYIMRALNHFRMHFNSNDLGTRQEEQR